MDGGGCKLLLPLLLLTGWVAGQRVNPPGAESPLLPQVSHPSPPPKSESSPPLQASTKPVPPPDPLVAGHDLEVGTFYYNRGDYIGALARFEDAIYNDPHSPEGYCRAGDANFKLKHALPARVDWQRCETMAEGSGKWAQHAREQLKKHKEAPGPS